MSARLAPYVLLAPAAVMLAIFVAGPVVLAFAIALFDWNVLAGTREFVGLDNFERLLPSDELLGGLRNTLAYALLTVPVSVGLGLVVALAIDGLRRGRALWRAVYFLPMASTLVAMAVTWRWLFYPETGLVDATVGRVLGLEGWLTSTSLALPALAVVGNWQTIGFATVIFLAGLAGVPRHLHDAARLDGAGRWARFWHVTWPALGPSTVFAVVITTITSLRVFDAIVVMTDGGPLRSTETLAYLIWRRGVDYLDLGGGAVINVVLVLVVLPLVVLQTRGFGRRLEETGRR